MYDKNNWVTGDVVTANKLNHMETGIHDAYVIPVATTSADGLMSSVDKGHLDVVYADYLSALTALGVS